MWKIKFEKQDISKAFRIILKISFEETNQRNED